MNLPRATLDVKIAQIGNGIKKVIKTYALDCTIWPYGAYWLEEGPLVFVIGVPKDADRDRLQQSPDLEPTLRQLLTQYGWPEANPVTFLIESQETVNRESDGNWFQHFR